MHRKIMGVMSCYRKECDNIMCNTYVPSVGYICYECKNEFKEYLESEGKTDLTDGEILRELEIFMNTTKGHHKGSKIDIDDFFNQYTR